MTYAGITWKSLTQTSGYYGNIRISITKRNIASTTEPFMHFDLSRSFDDTRCTTAHGLGEVRGVSLVCTMKWYSPTHLYNMSHASHIFGDDVMEMRSIGGHRLLQLLLYAISFIWYDSALA